MNDVFQKYLTLPGKTDPPLTIFEHSNDVLQVMRYLLQGTQVEQPDLLKLAALLHDVGKIEQKFDGQRWVHTPYTQVNLDALLDDARFKRMVAQVGIDLEHFNRNVLHDEFGEAYDFLEYGCESHHAPACSPSKLNRCKAIILVAVADMIASAVEKGYVGRMDSLLKASPYGQSVYNLLESLVNEDGLENLLDSLSREVHRIEFPAQFVEDELLVTAIFKTLEEETSKDLAIFPLLQRGQALWVAGEKKAVENALRRLTLSPGNLYRLLYGESIYATILSHLPAAGAMQIDSIKFILVSEEIARQYAARLMLRRSAQQLVERHNLSADEISRIMTGRGLGVAARLRALGGRIPYCLTGQTAAYFYSDWRYMPEKLFEIAISTAERPKVYAYLKNPRTYVSDSLATSRDFEGYDEIVVLHPRSDVVSLPVREIDGLRVLAPEALLIELIEVSEEIFISDAVALLAARRGALDWALITEQLSLRKLIRPGGGLCEVINAEAGSEVVPVFFIQELFARVSVTPDEKPYPFPLHALAVTHTGRAQRKTKSMSVTVSEREAASPQVMAIAARWGLEWRLPRPAIRKVLMDLGLVHE